MTGLQRIIEEDNKELYEKGYEKGIRIEKERLVREMYKIKLSISQISTIANISEEEVRQILEKEDTLSPKTLFGDSSNTLAITRI